MTRGLLFFIILCSLLAGLLLALRLNRKVENHLQQVAVQRTMPMVASQSGTSTIAVAEEIAQVRASLDKSIWSKEIKAQEYEETFVALWDELRAREDDQYLLLGSISFDTLKIGTFPKGQLHDRNIQTATMCAPNRTLEPSAWKQILSSMNALGYRLEYSEWHHSMFTPSETANVGPKSLVSIKLFVVNERLQQKIVVSGTLGISWGTGLDGNGRHLIRDIDATHLSVMSRIGAQAFAEGFRFGPEDRKIDSQASLDPVIVYDINGDGKPDILLPSINTLMVNRSTPGHLAFDSVPLCMHPVVQNSMESGPYVTAAILGDFLGHGQPDLLECGPGLVPTLFAASGHGQYTGFGEPVSNLSPKFIALPMCITAGDIHGNGNLDVWIGQYRRPYVDGNLPIPYWDANDGYPSFLLMNNGEGGLNDVTIGSGLENKRNRRNYSASLIDLNGDGKLDLVTVNDFAGVDIFSGHGDGRFTDVTGTLIDQRASFGMSHTIADIDGDGHLDLFIAGMGSTTARRLEQMKLGRPEYPEQQRMRMQMGYGNRLLLATADHKYHQAAYNDNIARTGWSWGSAAIDPDNSGSLDLYLSNGNLSRSTAKDYCTRYWTQDIYMGTSQPSAEWKEFFRLEDSRLKGYSWNPFEHKAFLMNEGNGQFLNIAYLLNLGFEYDARQVVAVDFDGDGRTDLLEVELRPALQAGMLNRPILHLYRNQMPSTNHWLEVAVPDAPHRSPLGSTVTVHAGGRHRIAAIVSGDSYRSQHPPTVHFGLGSTDRIESVTVKWSDGKTTSILMPAIDSLLTVRP